MEPADNYLQNQIYEVHQKYYETYKNVVYRRTRKRLARYGNGHLKQDAEDLLQETFHSVFRWMKNYFEENDRYPSEEIFERVLKTIEINEYRSYLRRLKNPVTVANANGTSYNNQAGDSGDWIMRSQARNPEQELLWREYESQVGHCLKKLKPREHTALLCKARGDSDKEVAAVIGQDEKKVTHSTIPLARKKLRKCLEGYLHGNEKR
jgi:RNA polymerase sigma factor (sigma-70 family)